MIKRLLLLIVVLLFQMLSAQNEFITVWKPGTSNLIHFPGRGTNFNVSWEEIGFPQHSGNIDNITSTTEFIVNFGASSNPSPANATYKIKVSNGNGVFNQVRFFDSSISPIYIASDREKILQVTQWGNITWQTFNNAFVWCSNLQITATDSPNLTQVTNMQEMFYMCFSLTGNSSLSNWNTSNVTNMFYMFGDCPLFNAPIGNWNVSNVTNMSYMFDAALAFNQPISEWNVANVTTMQHMFHEAQSFNQDLSGWNVSNVVNMNEIFHDAQDFNQNLGNWNLNSLTNGVDMLLGSGLSCQNYDSTLYGWSLNSNTPQNITLSNVSPLIYSHSAAVNARNYLINTKGWAISGDTYNSNCASALSTSENKLDENISIYPNPVADNIYIKNLSKAEGFTIYENTGRIVLQGSVSEGKIDTKTLNKGNYILQLKTKSKTITFKFIKK